MPDINSDNRIKVIAFYLPQYHSIPENDKAWGKGFTEWTNVKKAEPLFEGHYQPKKPLNENYYNLLDTDVQRWQAETAKKYGVWGFCYYHYWFKDGKQLLEKPAENMLAYKSVDEPFCFCWANENWSKRWDGGNSEIIVEQDYGEESDWEKHFNYLLPFFKDERYITFDGKPVLLIYRAELIDNLKPMLEHFRKLSTEAGFPGLEIMFQHPSYIYSDEYDEAIYDHYVDFEPAYTLAEETHSGNAKSLVSVILGDKLTNKLAAVYRRNIVKGPVKKNYDEVWKKILNREYPNERFIPGCFTNWDNTPRTKAGLMFSDADPDKFRTYFSSLADKVEKTDGPKLIFVNAWNEWGEGAYLEPDEKYGYSCLEAIRDSVN